MEIDVVKNAKRNIIFGIVNKVIIMLCPFIERTLIQYILGAKYLGLDSLFNSILSVLSITELGFSSAVIYNMYKPVAKGDTATVNALLNFYRKVYRIIGLLILVIGLGGIPFLTKLISGEYPEDLNLIALYLIYLINVVISYFMYAYMSSLIVVYQRDDISSTVNSVTKILLTVAQILVLIITKNYYLIIALMPVFTIINNLWTAIIVKKNFPMYHCQGKLPKEKIKEIKKLVMGTFIQRACAVTRNSLDSICLSAFLGLTITAIYNNYYMISSAVTTCLGIVSVAFVGGIGNHVATRSAEKNFDELMKIDFAYMLMSGWCAICLLCLYQPFMKLWMGEEMLFPISTVIIFVLYFYALKLGDMRTMYSTTNGLWWHHRYRSIAETILNLVLNITLGYFWGVRGIIMATMISLLVCNFIWGTQITIKMAFGEKYIKPYYIYHAKYGIVSIIICIITFLLCNMMPEIGAVTDLIIRIILCMVVPGILYVGIYYRNENFKYMLMRLRKKNKMSY